LRHTIVASCAAFTCSSPSYVCPSARFAVSTATRLSAAGWTWRKRASAPPSAEIRAPTDARMVAGMLSSLSGWYAMSPSGSTYSLRKTPLFSQPFLCLSRACLGKKSHMWMNSHSNRTRGIHISGITESRPRGKYSHHARGALLLPLASAIHPAAAHGLPHAAVRHCCNGGGGAAAVGAAGAAAIGAASRSSGLPEAASALLRAGHRCQSLVVLHWLGGQPSVRRAAARPGQPLCPGLGTSSSAAAWSLWEERR
jgi:hypothetical protein